jgi:hypothetical protein
LIQRDEAINSNFSNVNGIDLQVLVKPTIYSQTLNKIFLTPNGYSKMDQNYRSSEEKEIQRLFDTLFNIKNYLIYNSIRKYLDENEQYFTKYPICVDKIFMDAYEVIIRYYPDYRSLNFDGSGRCDYQCLDYGTEEENKFNKLFVKRSDHLYVLIHNLDHFISIVLSMKNSIITRKSFPAICLIAKIAILCRYEIAHSYFYRIDFMTLIKCIAYKPNISVDESKLLYTMLFKELARIDSQLIMSFVTNLNDQINPWAVHEIAKSLDLYSDPNHVLYIIDQKRILCPHAIYFKKIEVQDGVLSLMKQIATSDGDT